MKRTRKNYIPSKAELHLTDNKSDAVIYRYEKNGRPIGLGFHGRSQKPSWHYRFESVQQQEQFEQKFINFVRATEEQRKQYFEEKNKLHTLKVGDVLYTSWGYDQTNTDFYLIIKVVGKLLFLQEIEARNIEPMTWSSDIVVADPEMRIGLPFVKRADGFNTVKINSHCTAYLYHGRPLLRSWYRQPVI